jgi:hypothetical protein
MLVLEVLVGEFAAVDALACEAEGCSAWVDGGGGGAMLLRTAGSIVIGKIAALTHELRYDAVEGAGGGVRRRHTRHSGACKRLITSLCTRNRALLVYAYTHEHVQRTVGAGAGGGGGAG